MEIQLFHIGEEFSHFHYEIFPQDLKRLDRRFAFESVACRLRLKRESDIIRFFGCYQTVFHTTCDYCLSPAILELKRKFHLDLVQEGEHAEPEGDTEIHLHENDTEYYSGQELFVTRYFEDQILLDIPIALLCSETCRGICTQCGVNKNESSCECDKEFINNPFAILRAVAPDIPKG